MSTEQRRPPSSDGIRTGTQTQAIETTQLDRGTLASAISNLVVQTTAEYTGRGPTRARTTIDGDWIFVTLADTLTKGERKLYDSGRGHLVRTMRREFQDAMREQLVEKIQELTGREVVAMLSDNHLDPDLAIEAFHLLPVDSQDTESRFGDNGQRTAPQGSRRERPSSSETGRH